MAEMTWDEVKVSVQNEIKHGGDLKTMPCPFCGLPRCSRSNYIRCSKCGVNWGAEDDLSADPRIGAYRKMVDSAPKRSKTSE